MGSRLVHIRYSSGGGPLLRFYLDQTPPIGGVMYIGRLADGNDGPTGSDRAHAAARAARRRAGGHRTSGRYGAAGYRAANRLHYSWLRGTSTVSRRHGMVPPMGGTALPGGRGPPAMAGGNGAACWRHVRAGLRSQAGGSGASGTAPSMVPPMGGTVYGGTVWCRRWAARHPAALEHPRPGASMDAGPIGPALWPGRIRPGTRNGCAGPPAGGRASDRRAEWCRRWAARYRPAGTAPPIGGAASRNGAADRRHGIARHGVGGGPLPPGLLAGWVHCRPGDGLAGACAAAGDSRRRQVMAAGSDRCRRHGVRCPAKAGHGVRCRLVRCRLLAARYVVPPIGGTVPGGTVCGRPGHGPPPGIPGGGVSGGMHGEGVWRGS